MNRYYDEEELTIPEVNPCLHNNIKILREEARLTINEFSELMNVNNEDVKEWESGKKIPSQDKIIKMTKILRISHYDIMTRDIKKERGISEKKLKSSKDRQDYNWFYGSKKIIILNLIYLIGIPLVYLFLVLFWQFVPFNIGLILNLIDLFGEFFNYALAYVGCAFISGWIIAITFMIKKRYRFQFWHIFLISIFITIVELVGLVGTIPYYIYVLVKLIILRGRNHR